ncbi:glycosyltransferase family 2 protein [Pantoea sp. FN0302]|uniref:glycosyltransferase family 2 protein n=1 Tax=Pantoea sp. FN0302 TaxID=3418558 RepID=UPI003CEF3D3D
MQSLTFPYLIMAPDYRESSQGIQVMHQLGHMINQQGGKAWMVGCTVNPQWNTPRLDEESWHAIIHSGQPYIAVYPEVTSGNPLSAPVCVRYMLNREGVIMKNRLEEGPDDLFFWYRKEFAEKAVNPDILRIESFDLDLFCDDNPDKDRDLLYLNRVPESAVDFSLLPPGIQILSMRNPLSLQELAAVLKRTRVLYSYESSGTCALAILCGSPVVALTAPGYEQYAITPDTLKDNGGAGFSWDPSPEAIAGVRRDLYKVRDYFLSQRAESDRQLQHFLHQTQRQAQKVADERQQRSLPVWLMQRTLTPGERERLELQPVAGRRLLIVIHQDNETVDAVSKTLETLLPQLRQLTGSRVLLVSDSALPLSDDPLVQQSTASAWMAMVAELSQQQAFDWLQSVPAGTQYSAQGLLLASDALGSLDNLAIVYADEMLLLADGEMSPHFKPDFNLDLFLSAPRLYLQRAFFQRDALISTGGFDTGFPHSFELDAVLKMIAQYDIGAIGHLTETVTLVPAAACEFDASPEQQALLRGYLHQRGYLQGTVEGQPGKPWRLQYDLQPAFSLSAILLAGDNLAQLQRCLTTFFEQTRWANYELLIVTQPQTPQDITLWLQQLAGGNLPVRLINVTEDRSTLCINAAAAEAQGEYLLLLDANSVFVMSNWLNALASDALRPEVGCVAPQIINFEQQLLSAGYILGVNGLAFPVGYGERWGSGGHLSRLHSSTHCAALSSHCLLIRRSVWQHIGGFDPQFTLPLLAEIDFCLQVAQAGLLLVCTPYSLIASEATISGYPARFLPQPSLELDGFYQRWLPALAQDATYHCAYSLTERLFAPDTQLTARWRPLRHYGIPYIVVIQDGAMDSYAQRLVETLHTLSQRGRFYFTLLTTAPSAPELLRLQADCIVLSGEVNEATRRTIAQVKASHGVRVAYLADSRMMARSLKPLLQQEFIDSWLVYSRAQADWFNKRHKKAVILPNVLTAQWQDKSSGKANGATRRVLCATCLLTEKERQLIAPAIAQSAAVFDWIILGDCPTDWLPFVRETHRCSDGARMMAQLAGLSVEFAVLPRSNGDENRFKDSFILLQLASLGIPALCSDVPSLASELPTWRVKNSVEAWRLALDQRRDAPAESGQMAAAFPAWFARRYSSAEAMETLFLQALTLTGKE